jgi:alanyl-tRNA synthetase
MRRAIRYANELNSQKQELNKLVKPLISLMGNAYPELEKNQKLL